MNDLGKITITKNKDCDNKTYYSAYIYGIDAVIGGGDTRNEAKDELFGNIVFYVNYLIETNQKLKQQLAEKQNTIDEINKEFVQAVHYWKNLLKEKDKEIESYKNKAYIDMLYKESLELKLDNQTQLAIQELEKVKYFVEDIQTDLGNDYMIDRFSILKQIDQQIKELKGDKDVKD